MYERGLVLAEMPPGPSRGRGTFPTATGSSPG